MTAVLLERIVRWRCPNCDATDATREPAGVVRARFHPCRGLKGMSAPFVEEGVRCKIIANEREDYEGADSQNVQRDSEGRPIMSIVTVRDDGQDCRVFMPAARASLRPLLASPVVPHPRSMLARFRRLLYRKGHHV